MRNRTSLATTISSFALMAASACGGDSKSSFSSADSGAGGEAGSTVGSGGDTGSAGTQSASTGGAAGSATTGSGGASAGAAGSPGAGGSSIAGSSSAGAPGAGGTAPAGAGGVVTSAGAAGAAGSPSSAGTPGTAGVPGTAGTTSTGGSVTAGAGGTAGAAGTAGTAGAVTVAPVCGNGVVESGEQCDDGNANDDNASGSCPSVCRTSCQCPGCGDGVTDFVLGEECDDLNNADGDGCSATCTVEAAPSCGDGTLDIDQGEECDDGNTATGDGCDDACQLEPVGQTCGDGTTDTLEKCDDNNVVNGDGCNPTCNLTGTVTTLATGVIGSALAVDDTYLWVGGCDNPGPTGCHISRIDIDDCLNNNNCTPALVVGGACGTAQDGPAASAAIGCPGTMTTDGDTLWFGDGHLLRALDIQSMTVSTLAGSPNLCAAIDGTGSAGLFHDIRGLTYYDGYVYLLDGCEEVLRRFDPSTDAVTTIAGTRFPDPTVPQTGANAYVCPANFTCTTGTPADGQGLNAVFGSPRYMTADNSGNLYITDTNGQMLRTYNTVTGWVGTLVGGTQGYVDGVGTAAELDRPRGVTSDGTSVYWAEQNQYTVRQVEIQSAQASTLIGVRGCAGSTDGTGADATQNWSGNCSDSALSGLPNIDTSLGGIAFHFPSQSIFLLEGGRLRRIE